MGGSQWNPFQVDLAADREQWGGLDERERGLIHWVLSSLMVAEERITTKFAGLVAAHGTEEATFLATQQVDEARHMQFYARFQDEVVADPATSRPTSNGPAARFQTLSATYSMASSSKAHERLLREPDKCRGPRSASSRSTT